MGLPVAVTASLMLSSMLGLRFEAKSDGKWNHHFVIQPIRPHHMKPSMKPVMHTTNPPPVQNNTTDAPTYPSGNNSVTTESMMTSTEMSSSSSSSEKPGMGNVIGSLEVPGSVRCGPARCRNGEICVSWVKVRNETGRRSRESPLMSHQCLQDDGTHYSKMDPEGIQLCENGQVPRILKKDQSCLRDDPPCPLVWDFECISEADAVGAGAKLHSCKVMKCPVGVCVEVVNCELIPPCYTRAECSTRRG